MSIIMYFLSNQIFEESYNIGISISNLMYNLTNNILSYAVCYCIENKKEEKHYSPLLEEIPEILWDTAKVSGYSIHLISN